MRGAVWSGVWRLINKVDSDNFVDEPRNPSPSGGAVLEDLAAVELEEGAVWSQRCAVRNSWRRLTGSSLRSCSGRPRGLRGQKSRRHRHRSGPMPSGPARVGRGVRAPHTPVAPLRAGAHSRQTPAHRSMTFRYLEGKWYRSSGTSSYPLSALWVSTRGIGARRRGHAVTPPSSTHESGAPTRRELAGHAR